MSKNVLKSDVTAEALIAKAQRDGVETMWDRQAAQKTQCGFGEAGVCCRICAMGPCRVSPIPGKGARHNCSKKLCKNDRWWCVCSFRSCT